MRRADSIGNPEQEAHWIRQIARGDREAFENLFQAYQRRLGAYLYRILNDTEAVGEVANDVMVAIWKQARTFLGRSQPSTWILGIARYKALSRLRQEKPRAAVQELDRAEERAASIDDQEADAIRSELSEKLERALLELPMEQCEVVQLTFFQGLSYQETAEVLHCPLNTVKTRLFRAKKRLQPILTGMGIGRDYL